MGLESRTSHPPYSQYVWIVILNGLLLRLRELWLASPSTLVALKTQTDCLSMAKNKSWIWFLSAIVLFDGLFWLGMLPRQMMKCYWMRINGNFARDCIYDSMISENIEQFYGVIKLGMENIEQHNMMFDLHLFVEQSILRLINGCDLDSREHQYNI